MGPKNSNSQKQRVARGCVVKFLWGEYYCFVFRFSSDLNNRSLFSAVIGNGDYVKM